MNLIKPQFGSDYWLVSVDFGQEAQKGVRKDKSDIKETKIKCNSTVLFRISLQTDSKYFQENEKFINPMQRP